MDAKKKMAKSSDIIQIGTRGSKLALVQAEGIKRQLIETHPDKNLEIEIRVISTAGDRIQNRALSEVGGKGLFTLEIEEQLSSGELDLAVHSAKDMATKLPEELALVCFTKRESVADAFISNKASSPNELAQGAIVGSASLRRQAQLLRIRPDLKMVLFRGNVDTRLKKLEAGEVDATLLAVAGLKRLDMEHAITSVLPPDVFPPAPGQGAVCMETREDNQKIRDLLTPLNHRETEIALMTERAFLAGLDGSCRTPIAAYTQLSGNTINFHGMILKPDGTECHEHQLEGSIDDAADIGKQAAAILRKRAGSDFFDGW